jgi:hypothetical protein
MMMPPEPGDPWYVDDQQKNQDLADFANEHLKFSDFVKTHLAIDPTEAQKKFMSQYFPKVPVESNFIEYSAKDAAVTAMMYAGGPNKMGDVFEYLDAAEDLCTFYQDQPPIEVFGVPVTHLELSGTTKTPCDRCIAASKHLFMDDPDTAAFDKAVGEALSQMKGQSIVASVTDEVYDFDDGISEVEASIVLKDGKGKPIKFDFTKQMFNVIEKILDSGMANCWNQTGKNYILKSEYMGTGYGYSTNLMGSGVPSKAAAYLGLLVSKVNTQIVKMDPPRQVAFVYYRRENKEAPLVIEMIAHKKPLKADLLPSDTFKS